MNKKNFSLPDADPVFAEAEAPKIKMGCSFQLELPLAVALIPLEVYLHTKFPVSAVAKAAGFASWIKKHAIAPKQEKGEWDALYVKFSSTTVGGY